MVGRCGAQGNLLFYFRDEMSIATQVKGVLCLEGANISARPPLHEAEATDAERFCLIVRLAARSAAVTKHPVYTFSVDSSAEQVLRPFRPSKAAPVPD